MRNLFQLPPLPDIKRVAGLKMELEDTQLPLKMEALGFLLLRFITVEAAYSPLLLLLWILHLSLSMVLAEGLLDSGLAHTLVAPRQSSRR